MLRKALAHRAPVAGRARYSGPAEPRRSTAHAADHLMGPSRRLLGGHLGSSVSALLDGQLDPEATERAWQHVLQCPPVPPARGERGLGEATAGPDRRRRARGRAARRGSSARCSTSTPSTVAWAPAPEVDRSARGRRRAGIVLVGAGSVSAAVFGLTTLAGSPMGIGGSHDTPAGNIGGGATRPTSTAVTPAGVAAEPDARRSARAEARAPPHTLSHRTGALRAPAPGRPVSGVVRVGENG